MRLILLLLLTLNALTLNAWAAGGQRIISTAPSITETLFAMGLGPRVVGVTIYCNFPAAALKLPKIGTLLKPDIEAIVALHPDLVVVQRQPNRLPEELARVHVPYIEVESYNLNAVFEQARAIGKAANASAEAERLIHSIQADMQNVAKLAAGRSRPSVAFIVGHTPGRLEGLIAGSGTSYFSDLLKTAGGTNVFSDVTVPYPKISLEEILARNPDVILELSGEDPTTQKGVVEVWRSHSTLKAVASGHVFAVPPGPVLIPGPRAAEAARQILYLLHPELKH
jgi:iron complex transport system substrate-binding protein